MIIEIEKIRKDHQRENDGPPANGGTDRLVHIPLHALMLGSANIPARRLTPMIRAIYPRSQLTHTRSVAGAVRALKGSVYDLVVLALDPLPDRVEPLVKALSMHDTPMPVLMIVGTADQGRLFKQGPPLPASWEVMASQELERAVFASRMRRAIENHQRHWELTHLHHAFRSSLAQYRNLLDEVPDLIFLCDRSGCLLDVNATAERMFGLRKDKLLLRPVFEALGMSREDFQRLVEQALSGKDRIEDFELELRPHMGRPIFGLAHMIRCNGAPGRPLQFQGVIKDISPHKLLECQLRNSEDQYKTLYELARINCSSLRLDEVVGRSLELIHRCCASAGTMLLLNHSYDELNLLAEIGMPQDLKERFLRSAAPTIGQGVIGSLALSPEVTTVIHPAPEEMHPVLAEWVGRVGPCYLSGVALGRTNPTLPTSILLLLIPRDREERLVASLLEGLAKTLEMGMTNCFHYTNSLESERRYRELWETAPTFFISLLKGGLLFEVNQTALQALGYPLQDLIGHPFKRIVDPEDHELFDRAHQELMESGTPQAYELRLVARSGERLIVSLKSRPLLDRNGQRIGEKAALNDITRDRELKARLRDYAENLERMVEERTLALTQAMNFLNAILEGSTEHAIVGLDQAGVFLHFNSGAQILFDYTAVEMVGQRSLESLIDFERADFRSLADLMREVDEQGVLVREIPLVTRHGRQLTALFTMHRLTEPADGNLTYIVIMRDISEQKEMEDLLKLYTENLQQVVEQKTHELDRQNIQLIQSSKLATLGEMATGIAHELNQPLSGIRMRAQLVGRTLECDSFDLAQLTQTQREIIELVDRISHIINHMRIFARQDQQCFAPFDLRQSIEGALSLLGEQLRIHNVEVVTDIDNDPPLVLGEPLQIEQVILNLVSNARDAMDARHDHELRTMGRREHHKRLRIVLDRPAANEARLRIIDNGTGMSQDTVARIFDPFFTTKPVGRGTGLGLSISYGIISSHNGRIEADSTPGTGTTFSVWLPVWNEEHQQTPILEQEDLVL